MRILAFTAAKTVGKTTVAKALQTQDHHWELMSFAAPLKKAVAALRGQETWTDRDKDERCGILGCTPRQACLNIGDLTRKVNPSIYVEIMRRKIEAERDLIEYGHDVVIDDLRTELEAQMIKEEGGTIIRLFRKGVDYTLDHDTETPIGEKYLDAILDAGDINACVRNVCEICNAKQ